MNRKKFIEELALAEKPPGRRASSPTIMGCWKCNGRGRIRKEIVECPTG